LNLGMLISILMDNAQCHSMFWHPVGDILDGGICHWMLERAGHSVCVIGSSISAPMTRTCTILVS
jgi:hypothetical protein